MRRNVRWADVDLPTVVARIYEGASYTALAREFGIPPSTFRSRIAKLVAQARPAESSKIITPRDIAERVRRREQARRTDEILRRAGLNPVSRFVGTEIRNLRPLRPSFLEVWRGRRFRKGELRERRRELIDIDHPPRYPGEDA